MKCEIYLFEIATLCFVFIVNFVHTASLVFKLLTPHELNLECNKSIHRVLESLILKDPNTMFFTNSHINGNDNVEKNTICYG